MRFTCDDGSGTFDVSMVVKLDLITHEITANWNIAGGSGHYAGFHGNGKLIGIPIVPGISILDIYEWKLHWKQSIRGSGSVLFWLQRGHRERPLLMMAPAGSTRPGAATGSGCRVASLSAGGDAFWSCRKRPGRQWGTRW